MLEKFLKILIITIVLSSLELNTNKVVAATLSYKGKMDLYQIHEYKINVADESTLSISSLLNNENVFYNFSLETDGQEPQAYIDGEVIPPGTYRLSIQGLSPTPIDYEIVLGGLQLLNNPDQTLPYMNITNPIEYYSMLGINQKNYTVSGSHDGVISTVNQFHGPVISLPQSFINVSLNAGFGENKAIFYSKNSFGNGKIDTRIVTSPGIKRITGAERVETAVNISREMDLFGLLDKTVYLIGYNSFYDGFSAVPAAVREKAPILYTQPNYLPLATKNEILRLNAERVVIVGGTASVSTMIETELRNIGVSTVERISGETRYDVNVELAKKIINEQTHTALITTAKDFADAMAVSSLSAQIGMPLIYVDSTSIPPVTEQFLKDHRNINKFIIIGGTENVSDNVQNILFQYGDVERLSGVDKYDTSAFVGEYLNHITTGAVVTNGNSFEAGLPGSVLSGLRNYRLLLTSTTSLSYSVNRYLMTFQKNNVYILGDTSSVSPIIEHSLNNYITTGGVFKNWQLLDGFRYYFSWDGVLRTNWQYIDGIWYYLGSDGKMRTNWQEISGKWYYLGLDGKMKTGWQQVNEEWYYLESNGAMKTGWLLYNGKWYYLNLTSPVGHMSNDGWQWINGKCYYFYTDGTMAVSTTIDGYKVGTDGAWIQ